MGLDFLYFLTLLLYFSCSNCFESDQNYVGVSYTPYVKQYDNKNFHYTSYTKQNIKTMLTVVSGEFSKVIVRDYYAIEDGYIENITYHHGSYASVYSGEVAAKINREKGKKVLTVLYEARVSNFVIEPNVDIQLALEAAEKANEIYPGTVQGVILGAKGISKMQQTLDNLKAFRQNTTKLQLKLGAQLDCIAFLQDANKDLVNLQKMIIAEAEIISCSMIAFRNPRNGPVAAFKSIAKTLLVIREEITNVNPNVTVIGNLQWSSSGLTEWETIENLKLYWESVSKWSTEEKYTVYLTEAFDNPWRTTPPSYAHLGWWKLKDNSQINSADAYVEKYADNFACSDCFEFDQNYFGVSYSPFVKRAHYDYELYTYENIKTMLSVVSGKFSRLLVTGGYAIEDEYIRNVTYRYGSYANVYSGEVAAKINQEKGKKVLTLLYEAQVSGSLKETKVEIQLALEASEKANEIYPGTVEGILLVGHTDLSLSKMQQILNNLHLYRVNTSKLQIKLGAQLDCNVFLENGYKVLNAMQMSVIAESEIISCWIITLPTDGPVSRFKSVAESMLTFREEVTKINPNVKVIGNLEWSSNGLAQWEITDNLRLYWESVSKWSSKEKYTVYLEEAFDNPWRATTAHLGWWKLIDNWQINSVGGYVENFPVILDSPADNFTCSGCFEFDQNHFGVSFTPYVRQNENFPRMYYTYENIKTMLTVISGKFTRVFVKDSYGIGDEYIEDITYRSGSHATVYSGEIAAKLNLEKKKKILTLLYEVKIFESVESTHSEMQLVLEGAKKSNEIYPGTVEGVLFGGSTDVSDVSKMQQVFDNLKSFKRNTSALKIKVGAEIDCLAFFNNDENDNTDLVNLQESVIVESDIISCKVIVLHNPEGPIASFELFAKALLAFRQVITNFNSNVKVIGNLEWSSSEITERETVENLGLYWEYVSKWSSRENYTVYLKEAFDNPRRYDESPSDAHLGWWKLKDDSKINYIGAYVEKVSAAPDNNKTFHGAVIIEPNVLKDILNLKTSLHYDNDDYTEHFLSTFSQFVITFDWYNDSRNDVLQMTAEYNKQNIGNDTEKSENAIQIWLSFQPRRDITVDLDVIADTITTVNAKYPGTVSTVVLNYGSLVFFKEEITLVKLDMQAFNSKFKSLANENLRLGLQFHEMNCMNHAAYTMSLEYNLVDIVLITPQNKQEDIAKVLLTSQFCNILLNQQSSVAFNTHLIINIEMYHNNYSYNHELLNRLKVHTALYYKHIPFLMYAEIEKQTSDESVENFTMRADLETWLQQDSKFNGIHFGAWYELNKPNPNIEAVRNTIASLNLHKILLSTDSFAVADGGKILQHFLTELIKQGRANARENNTPLEILLLVTLGDKELELNKRKIKHTLSAAAEANTSTFGNITTIIFDWMVCNNTTNNECSELHKMNECWIHDKFYDTFRLLNFTREIMANKTWMNGSTKTFNLVIMVDANFRGKVYMSEPCYQLGKVQRIRKDSNDEMLKYMCQSICSVEELLKIGAKRMSVNVVENFTQCMSPIIVDVSYYLKITGCDDVEHGDIKQLTEYVDLVERMNKWAEYVNRIVFVNMGIEDTVACGRSLGSMHKKACTCGWWIQTKNTEDGLNYTLQNKKSRALQIFQRARNLTSPTPSPPYPSPKSSLPTEMLLVILIPELIFAILISTVTIFLVFHYKSKDAMSQQEVMDFFRGKRKQRIANRVASETADNDNSAEDEPYNLEKYELTPSSFTIDTSSTLGSGEFGKVHRGSIKLQDGTIETVAVKVTRTPEFGKSHGFYMSLKGLISEIKILSFVGQHNHVVSLLGAYTAKLRKGDIAVFLEYCPLGSLDKYLRSIEPQGISGNDQSPASSACSVREYANTCVKNLLDKEIVELMSKWTREIVCGMEFLTSKKIVHADLATRNILLTADKIAKIADFGLSRRLYDYSEYVKKNQGPLPWRWMAPEALRRMVFNEKTDVWAFAVTLWEIFSLGDEPYSGLNWHVNFPSMLERGLLLPEPKYDTLDIYSVMVRCWNVSPARRPSFAELSSEFNKTMSGEHVND